MELRNKIALLAVLAALTAGIYAGRVYFPHTQTIDKEIIKKDVQTVVKEVVRPDGTKEITTTIVDNSTEKFTKTTQAPVVQKNWRVGLSVDKSSILGLPVYGVQVEKRIVGPIFAGIKVNTDKQVGAVLAVEF